MLKDKNNDLLYLLSIIESVEKVMLYSKDSETAISFFDTNDQINFNATLTLLIHIGETVGKLSDDLLEKSPEIHWKKIRGLRHRIAHDYIALDIVIIFDVVKNKLPDFLNAVYALTVKRLHEGILSAEELNLAVGSRYYRHIDFKRFKGD
ncbi:MAG: DUF86 domain-containing protein [Methylococcales bacterium]|nr:DUF86 domain-containing protein [Methylococcales bacterium]